MNEWGRCQKRLHHGDVCGEEATHHVILDSDMNQTWACDQHVLFARRNLDYLQIHERAPDCGMPSAVWIEEDETCVVPPELDPLYELSRSLTTEKHPALGGAAA